MARAMAVSFERYGRLYYLDPGDVDYAVGDRVLVPTDSGPEVAECVWAPELVDDDADFGSLPRCAGRATAADLDRDAANRRRRAEAKLVVKRLVRQHGLPMKVVGVDYVDSGVDYDQLTVIYFTAPQRVDFRALVGELARCLRSRVDLRQIGSREAARITGGLGNCGRDLCCATFLSDFEPVSLRMARVQDLPPNPLRISGACGRLMCCLKYEHPLYIDFTKSAPAIGSTVSTPEGGGVVVAHHVPADAVVVRVTGGATVTCSKASVCGSRAAYSSRDPGVPHPPPPPPEAPHTEETGPETDPPEPVTPKPGPGPRRQRLRRRQ